ncbi:cytochrome P450 [Aspergillus heterothallicus]
MLSPAIILIGALCLALLGVYRINKHIQQRKKAKAWGCQPPLRVKTGFYGIPAFIELSKAAKERRWVEFIASRYQEFGNTFIQTFIGKDGISTVDPQNLKAMLATKFEDFSLGTRHREFYPALGDGIFTLDGAGWSHARALLRPQFTRDQVADLDLMDGHVTRMMGLIPKDGSIFDIQRLFFLLTIDSATHFLFGESVGAMEGDSVLGNAAVGGSQGFAADFSLVQEYLTWRSMALDFYWMINPKEFREATRRVHEVVDHYVYRAIEAKNRGEKDGGESGRYVFAEALAKNNDNPKVLRDNMLNILLAGRDTTASLLSSTFWYLARHQAVWEKLRRMIVEEFGDAEHPRGQITHARLKDLPYLRYVLNEVLRLLPPVPLNFRVANKDTSLPVGGGPDGKSPIFIHKGQPIMYSVYAMHRRKDLWGADAEVFRPERWEENAKRGWEYLPFNGGARICLGQQYALTEASYTMVKLLMRYKTVENADPWMKAPIIQSNLTMAHGDGVNIRLY